MAPKPKSVSPLKSWGSAKTKRTRAAVTALYAAFEPGPPQPEAPQLPLLDLWRSQAEWETSVQAPILYERHEPPT